MQLKTLAVFLFASAATAQTSTTLSPSRTTTSPSTTRSGTTVSTSLVTLVNQLPRCALSCLQQGATAINCNVANFSCLCNNSSGLISNISACVLLACGDQTQTLLTLTPQICAVMSANPDPTQVASASNIVASAINSVSSSRSQAAAPAMRTDAPALAVMGGAAAAWAAYAL